MTAAEELADSLRSFAQSCGENERLTLMIRDWNRVWHIHADDLGLDHQLVAQGGKVTTETGTPPNADMTIRATAEILTQVFYGELSPNEPYNDGTLRIQGAEEDIVRLDFVIAMLWE
jgi:putative sterol carrier protein